MSIHINRISFVIGLLALFSSAVYAQRQARSRVPGPVEAEAKKACLPAQITVSKTVLCAGESLDLRSNILPEYRYRWFKDGAVLVGESTYLLTIDMPGMYKLEVTNTALANCVQTTTVVIRQSPLRKLSLLPLTQQVPCEGEPLVAAIDVGSTNPASVSLTYHWQRNGFTLPQTSPTIRADAPGVYSVFVLDGDCEVSAGPLEVFTKPKPDFPVIPAICANSVDRVGLVATPAGGMFSGNGVQNGQFYPKLVGAGQQTVTYSVTNTNGCPALVNQTIDVISVPQPDLGPSQTIIAGTQVVLQGPSGPDLSYTWDPINGLLTEGNSAPSGGRLNLPRVIAQPVATTTYRLTVSQDSQCPLSSSVVITVLPGLFFPSAFTPNGDGQNDTWTLIGIEAFPLCSVRIYNRWGELILHESPYREPWDGRVRGERVAPGPYRYVISPAPFLPERAGTLTVLE
ncbi:gliding motility-associated C-terminal domain-containing protein [Fibrella arboris]|uniref:gliding motility-associated C-terminal domain-containing protein n=1 Tax=Fibrella arboris TaxID=3242486 RepID=UPI00352091D7